MKLKKKLVITEKYPLLPKNIKKEKSFEELEKEYEEVDYFYR
jgi:hypothetical protein